MPPSRVRIPPSPLRSTERCPSGLRSATGNRVRAERCVAGSNPALSVSPFLSDRCPAPETALSGAGLVQTEGGDWNSRSALRRITVFETLLILLNQALCAPCAPVRGPAVP